MNHRNQIASPKNETNQGMIGQAKGKPPRSIVYSVNTNQDVERQMAKYRNSENQVMRGEMQVAEHKDASDQNNQLATTDQGQIESGISSAFGLSGAHDKIRIDI